MKEDIVNVLVIEDNPGDADLIDEMLADQPQFQVAHAYSLAAGMACLKEQSISLILLDLSLPDSLGWNTYSSIHKEVPDIPIVILTGNKDERLGLLTIKSGAQDYLVKGFTDPQLLSRTISYAIERKRLEITLAENEGRIRSLVESVREVIFHLDPNGMFTVLNPAWTKILGIDTQTSLGKPFLDFVYAEDRLHCEELFDQLVRKNQSISRFEVRFIKQNGAPLWMEADIAQSYDSQDKVIGAAGTLSDISQRKENEAHLVYMATHDELTGLPNRNLFEDRLTQIIATSQRTHRMAAVIFLDLDQFKMVNDSMGHDQGDILLRAVAAKLLDTVRANDTVARFGGDEFVILLSDIETDQDAWVTATKIMEKFDQPILVNNQELYAAGSMGIAMFPRDGATMGQLVRNADTAMYRSKDLGRKQICFYSPELNAKLLEQLTLGNDLRKAISNNELQVYYQPKVLLTTGGIIGFEALLRWQHPRRGLVGPAEVIGMAEASDLILKIGAWVLRTAAMQWVRWRESGFGNLTMAVNLSLKQFWQNDLVQSTVEILQETGMAPNRLELEITESHVMRSPDETIATLRKLSDMGITLSIDDFGTGYSSLSYLKRFPIQSLKIDQSFVKDITCDQDAAAITQAIIALAHTMNLYVIAEGVQTEAQCKLLQQWHCDAMQGYLVSKPLTSVAAMEMLQQKVSFLRLSSAG